MQNNISNHDLKKRENAGWDKMKSQLDIEMPIKKKDRRRIFWLFFFMGVGSLSVLWNQYSTSLKNTYFQETILNSPDPNESEIKDNPVNEPIENEIENAEFIKNKPIASVENSNASNTTSLQSSSTNLPKNEKLFNKEAIATSKKKINTGDKKIYAANKTINNTNSTVSSKVEAEIVPNNSNIVTAINERTMEATKTYDKSNTSSGKNLQEKSIVESTHPPVISIDINPVQNAIENKNERLYFDISFMPSLHIAINQIEKSIGTYLPKEIANNDDDKTEITILKNKQPGEWILQLNGDRTHSFNAAFPDYFGTSLMIGFKKQLHKFHFITQIGQGWVQSKNTYAYNFNSNSFTSNLDKASHFSNGAVGGLNQTLTIPADGISIKEIKVDPSRALSGIQSDTLSISSADNLVIQNSNSDFSIFKVALGYQLLPKFYIESGIALRWAWPTKKYITLQSNVGVSTNLPSKNSITNYFLTTGHSMLYGLELQGIYSIGKSIQLVGGGIVNQNNRTNSLFNETSAQSINSTSTRLLDLKNDGSAPHYIFNLGVRYRF